MIRVRVELLSAVTGMTSEIGRMEITNDARGSHTDGNYDVALMRRGAGRVAQRRGRVEAHKRLTYSVWVLVAKALKAVAINPSVHQPELLNDDADVLRRALAKCRDEVRPPDDCIVCGLKEATACASCRERARITGTLASTFALVDGVTQ